MLTPSEFVDGCRLCLARGGGPEEIALLVARAVAAQAERASEWEVDELMYRADDLLIASQTLPPGCISAIHDHGTWAVIGVSAGCEVQHFYEAGARGLVRRGDRAVRAGEHVVLPPQTIHAISNPLAVPTRGVHVYGKDLIATARRMWHPDTGAEMPFDMALFQQWEAALTRNRRLPGNQDAPIDGR